MEEWRHAWRVGVAPDLPTAGLVELRAALGRGEPALLRGETTYPAPLVCHAAMPCERACPVGYALWRGHGVATVGEVIGLFDRVYAAARTRVYDGMEPFLAFVDDGQPDDVRRGLEEEVGIELARRAAAARQEEAPAHA